MDKENRAKLDGIWDNNTDNNRRLRGRGEALVIVYFIYLISRTRDKCMEEDG